MWEEMINPRRSKCCNDEKDAQQVGAFRREGLTHLCQGVVREASLALDTAEGTSE